MRRGRRSISCFFGVALAFCRFFSRRRCSFCFDYFLESVVGLVRQWRRLSFRVMCRCRRRQSICHFFDGGFVFGHVFERHVVVIVIALVKVSQLDCFACTNKKFEMKLIHLGEGFNFCFLKSETFSFLCAPILIITNIFIENYFRSNKLKRISIIKKI